MQPFLALITPLGAGGGEHPSHPIAPGGPTPTPPIYYPPSVPPGYWGGGNVPMPTPPIYLPPSGGGSPVYPAHPIAPGGPPPVVWPGPGYPAHPIAPGGPPPGYWGGVAPPLPTHPIAPGGPPPRPDHGLPPFITNLPVVPPGGSWKPDGDPVPGWEIKTAWSSLTGWIVVAIPTDEVPTPSEPT
jgi:hypothetical protein